jgi:protein TonB
MHALRFPFAVGFGFLMALAVFTLLWKFVNRPIDVTPAVKAPDIHYTPKHVDTPVVPPRQPKVVRRPPPLIPPAASQARDNVTDATLVRYEPVRPGSFESVPAVVDAGRGGPPQIGQDRDVIPLVRVPPDYPPRANTEGWVKVQFSITEIGSVRDAFVVEASPAGVFDAAALKAIARWRYTPKIEGGVAVERVGVQTLIRFELQ